MDDFIHFSPNLSSLFYKKKRMTNKHVLTRSVIILFRSLNLLIFYFLDSVICFHTEPFASSPFSILSRAIFTWSATSNSGSCSAFFKKGRMDSSPTSYKNMAALHLTSLFLSDRDNAISPIASSNPRSDKQSPAVLLTAALESLNALYKLGRTFGSSIIPKYTAASRRMETLLSARAFSSTGISSTVGSLI